MQNDDPKLSFVTSSKSLKEVSQDFKGRRGSSYSYLMKRSMREGWTELRNEYRRALDGKAKAQLSAEVSGAADKSALAAMKVAEKVGNRLAPQIAMIYEQLLQTAIKMNAEADKVLLSGRIKTSSIVDGVAEIDIKDTTLADRLKAGQLHSMAVSTVRSLFPRETLQVDESDEISPETEEFDRLMQEKYGAKAVVFAGDSAISEQ
jgi:hypothetical protein